MYVKWFQVHSLAHGIGGLYLTKFIKIVCKNNDQSFENFLNYIGHKHKILHLWTNKNCCLCQYGKTNTSAGKVNGNQFKVLFSELESKCRHCSNSFCVNSFIAKEGITTKALDFSLGSVIFVNIMNCNNHPALKQAVANLRNLRNEVVHLSQDDLKDYDFSGTWNKIETELNIINGCLPSDSQKFLTKVQDKIEMIHNTTCRCGHCYAMISTKTLELFSSVSYHRPEEGLHLTCFHLKLIHAHSLSSANGLR